MAFEVDLVNQKGSLLYNVSDPADPIYTQTQGSFQFIGEAATTSNMFMGYGSVPMVKEYDGAGNVVLSGEFDPLDHGQSYRAFKFPWTANPVWSPVAVAVTSDNLTDVYMSWNGATEYDNWAIYAVPSLSSNTTTQVATAERTGFETHVNVDTLNTTYVKVAARQGNNILRWSDVVKV